jgi:S1-C subfamily serine protease
MFSLVVSRGEETVPLALNWEGDSPRTMELASRTANGASSPQFSAAGSGSLTESSLIRPASLGVVFSGNTLSVKAVGDDSPAREAGVLPGDTIVSLGAERVVSAADVLRVRDSLVNGDNLGNLRTVDLLVRRGSESRTLSLRLP